MEVFLQNYHVMSCSGAHQQVWWHVFVHYVPPLFLNSVLVQLLTVW